MKRFSIRSKIALFVYLFAFMAHQVAAQSTTELTTADEGGADIGLYNDNQRGAFTNQDGSGGVDIRDLGSDGVTDDSEVTRKRAGLLQFDLGTINPQQITAVDLEMFVLQGSTTADVEVFGVIDGEDILGLAGDGSPGFDPMDPDFHFANSGLFNYYNHDDALFPTDDPFDDDDVVNGGFFDSTLDLIESKVELVITQSEEGDEEPDNVISVYSSETPELLDFVQTDTNGKVLFLVMPTSGQAVTLNNGANGAAASLFVTFDESIVVGTTGDFDNDGNLDVDDLNALIGGIGGNDLRFDVTLDGSVDLDDVNNWVGDLKITWLGDANLDGEFNSGDLVSVFTVGKFESNEPAEWHEGDWNADGVFSSGDFVVAFADGGFERGPRSEAAAVPEPSFGWLIPVAFVSFSHGMRRK